MKWPTYLTKLQDELVWTALLAGVFVLIQSLANIFGWDPKITAATNAILIFLRLVIGLLLPDPTERAAVRDVVSEDLPPPDATPSDLR